MKEPYKIGYVSINEVHVNEKNPRLIKDEAFKRLKKSLKKSPKLFRARPLLCSDRTGTLVIMGGNMRYQAAKALKYTKVPVIIMHGLTEDEEKEIAIKDNGTFGEWDFSILASEWSDLPLEEWGVELPDNWLAGPDEVHEDDFDAQTEAKKITKPRTRLGDIWLLGKHRVMCGDATKREDVGRLLGAERAGLLLTDPPYGINIVGKVDKSGKGKIGGGGKRYAPVAGDTTTEAARKVYYLSQEMGIRKVILWGWNYFPDFLPPSPCIIVWDKRVETASNNFADCELAWTSFTSPARIYRQLWNGYTRQGRRDVEGLKRVHPTQKPVNLSAYCIDNYSKREEIILDLFLGSGSTLIAAEQLGRTCYGMEIDPIYCDVICKRWQDFTGKKPILKKVGGK
jgi:hypothetical protein